MSRWRSGLALASAIRQCRHSSIHLSYYHSSARAAPEENHASPEHEPLNHPRRASVATPRELVDYLSQFIIGQENAKKVLSVAVFNHYNRVGVNQAMKDLQSRELYNPQSHDPHTDVETARVKPIRPHESLLHVANIPTHLMEKSNVLVIGPTGSGKTLLARTLAQMLDVPFSVNDANAFTQAGYVGEDVEMVIQRLLQASNWDPERASKGICYIDEIDKIARKSGGMGPDSSRDVGGEGVQQALLRMMEGTTIVVQGKGSGHAEPPVTEDPPPPRSRQKTSSYSTPRQDVYHIDTSNILFILSGAFVGLDSIIKSRVAKGSIGFAADLKSDSLSSKSSSSLPFFTSNTRSASDNPLGLVETQDLIKYGHVRFSSERSGSNQSSTSSFIPEFISRLPSITTLAPLSISDLRRILSDVKGSLMSQYTSLFSYSGVEIQFTQAAQQEICRLAHERGGGARGLRGIMESLLLEPMYEVPGSDISYVLINEDVVRGSPPLYWRRDENIKFWQAFAQEEERYNNVQRKAPRTH